MHTIEKKTVIKYVLRRCLRILLICVGVALMIAACSKDPDEIKKDPPPTENPPGQGGQGGQDTIVTPTDSIDADVVMQYLKLVNATKISGQPPASVPGEIWNDVKDTLYLMRGLPVGKRVSFLHGSAVNVTGFYVYVPGASYYYDVPSVPEEARDSTDVVYIDAEFPVADFKDYPISFPIQLMPYVDGIPFDPFIEPVSIEDPNDSDVVDECNSILVGGNNDVGYWKWESTYRMFNDQILNYWAPGFRVGLNTLLGGCCRDDGVSRLAGDIGCSKIDSLRSDRQTWVEFPVVDGITSLYEIMSLYDDGTLVIGGAKYEAKIIPDTRDFCAKTVELAINKYWSSYDGFRNLGNRHDFIPGAKTMNIQLENSSVPPISFLSSTNYNLGYSCHWLVLIREDGEGGEWRHYYQKLTNYGQLIDHMDEYELEWYDNENNPFLISYN